MAEAMLKLFTLPKGADSWLDVVINDSGDEDNDDSGDSEPLPLKERYKRDQQQQQQQHHQWLDRGMVRGLEPRKVAMLALSLAAAKTASECNKLRTTFINTGDFPCRCGGAEENTLTACGKCSEVGCRDCVKSRVLKEERKIVTRTIKHKQSIRKTPPLGFRWSSKSSKVQGIVHPEVRTLMPLCKGCAATWKQTQQNLRRHRERAETHQ